ncbi:MAG: hypothetical protein O7G86_14170 [Gammaproteobacteria bacterium]|nr:hypothetical protein [Gammaproteobacteria bacterium]MCZ6855053.1 hypothetical protein [Gammaproteobacteria bacterium]
MKLVKFTLLFLIVSLTGCAAVEPNSLAAMQNHQVRSLAMACYHDNDGFRLVYGGPRVWEACKIQAEQKVGRSPMLYSSISDPVR